MSVKHGAIVLFVWGLLDGIMTVVQVPFKTREIQHAMLGTASILTIFTGFTVWMLDLRRRAEEPLLEVVTEASFASALTGLGVAILLLGGAFGFWLALIAAGVLGFGIGGVIRETVARRRDLRELLTHAQRDWLAGRLYEQPAGAGPRESALIVHPAPSASDGGRRSDGSEGTGGGA